MKLLIKDPSIIRICKLIDSPRKYDTHLIFFNERNIVKVGLFYRNVTDLNYKQIGGLSRFNFGQGSYCLKGDQFPNKILQIIISRDENNCLIIRTDYGKVENGVITPLQQIALRHRKT